MTNEEKILNLAKRIKALSDIGLLYCQNNYDIDRYHELQTISLELMNVITEQPVKMLKDLFQPIDDYPTPKVDIRALVLNEQNQILMIQESVDRCWALPGGWADIGLSPTEVAIKECKEESGLTVVPERLLAVFDKRCHPHPPQSHYVYKLIFHCKATTTELNKGFDVLNVGYFDIDNLPELSINRILKPQIELVYRKLMQGDNTVWVD